jgi:hypothetical protein
MHDHGTTYGLHHQSQSIKHHCYSRRTKRLLGVQRTPSKAKGAVDCSTPSQSSQHIIINFFASIHASRQLIAINSSTSLFFHFLSLLFSASTSLLNHQPTNQSFDENHDTSHQIRSFFIINRSFWIFCYQSSSQS